MWLCCEPARFIYFACMTSIQKNSQYLSPQIKDKRRCCRIINKETSACSVDVAIHTRPDNVPGAKHNTPTKVCRDTYISNMLFVYDLRSCVVMQRCVLYCVSDLRSASCAAGQAEVCVVLCI